MAITRKQARDIFEKDESIGDSFKRATAASDKRDADMKKGKTKGEPLMKRVRRKLYEVYHGKNAYMPEKGKK